MTPEAARKRGRAAELSLQAHAAREAVAEMERKCAHDFGPTEYDPVHHEGYHDPGDPPGTMGVDRRLPFDVPPRTDKRWRRECRICGKIEYTTKTDKHVTETPRFP